MRLFALLALCACARAATVALPKRNIDDLDNVDLDNVVSEPELVDQANAVKDIDNSLRNAIPVKVIQEAKIDENSNDFIPQGDSFNVKRAPIDLKNPGSPQRQEHETQNPESYTDAQKAVFSIKQTIEDTQQVFTLGLKGISENFNNLFANKEQLSTIQENIQRLKNSFNDQVLKLNNTIKSYINPDKVEETDQEVTPVETRLIALESNFKSGVHTLSEGVELLAIMKEEDEAAKAEGDAAGNPQPASSTQAPVAQNNNPVIQFLYNFQQGMADSISNLNNAVQNFFNPNQNQTQPQQASQQGGNFVGGLFQGIQLPFGQQGQQAAQQPAQQGQQKPPGTVADQPAQSGWKPPNIIEQVQNQWNNLVTGGQNTQQPQPSANPLEQAFHNVVQFFRPNGNQNQQSNPQSPSQNTASSAGSAEKPSSDALPGVNVIPADPLPQQAQPAAPIPLPQAAQAVQAAAPPPGPIQQLVQNNPIIKGLQTVATRITHSDRPRETVNKSADSKGGQNSGDNSNSSRIKEKLENIEKKGETPIKSEDNEKISEEISPQPAKTE